MPITIRPFAPADAAAVVAVGNATYPDLLSTVDELRHQDEHRPAHCKARRWVAELEGAVVGSGEYTQYEGRYHPRKFVVSVTVHPEYQGKAIGSMLYETVVGALAEFDPIALNAQARESLPRGLRFLERRGYVETMRTWESELDLAAFDPAPWLPYLDQAAAQGVVIRSLQELESDPSRNQKLYEMVSRIREDVPSPDPATPLGYESFIQSIFKDPSLLPEGYLVAVGPDGQYIGMSALWKDSGDGILWTGLTGLRREYRGMGVAQALKVKSLLWAQGQGKKGVRTFNASNNAPMLRINTQMGFVRKPAWIDFRLTLREE